MTENDFNQFSNIVVGLAELKGRAISAAGIKLYWNAMQHWPIQAFEAAAHHLVRICAFMPSPKDFEDLRRAQRPAGEEIWPRVQRWIRGFDMAPNDPIAVRAVAAMGGAYALGMRDSRDAHWMAKEFSEHYAELTDLELTREALPQLPAPAAQAALMAPGTALGIESIGRGKGPRRVDVLAAPLVPRTESKPAAPPAPRPQPPQQLREPDEVKARRALQLLAAVPGTSVEDAARMCRVSLEALRAAAQAQEQAAI